MSTQESSERTLHARLHTFLCEQNHELTTQWFATLDKSADGFYRDADAIAIAELKQLNSEFHDLFCTCFERTNPSSLSDLRAWINQMGLEKEHLSLPLEAIIKELFLTQKQYLQLIKAFADMYPVPHEQLLGWNQSVVDIFNDIVLEFAIGNTKLTQKGLSSQQDTIAELSAPVILLTKHVGLLPLIGEVTESRALGIFDNVLTQCHDKMLERLFIDLSGVPVIDTMVAHHIFQLIEGLNLLGVKVAIAGVSPVIAQTAVQLGIKFGDIEIYNRLEQAMHIHALALPQS